MRDVAGHAGVSIKTVSRVVNQEGGVRPDLVAQVERAIEVLGYQRDDRARQLRLAGGRTKTIGFIQVDVANPFFSAIFRGLEDVATAHGYHVIAGSSDGDAYRQDAVLSALIANRVDGIVVVPSSDRLDLLAAEMQRGTPVVFVDLEPPPGIEGDLVRSDHRGGARVLTQHLMAHGHERIAFIGDKPSGFSARERHLGFAEAMDEAGRPVNPAWVFRSAGDPGRSEGAVARMLDGDSFSSTPTALITAQSFITIGAVRALHRLGLQHRVALAGFDDLELADVVEPGITVMPQSPRELGRRAGGLLFKRLAGDGSPHVVEIPDDHLIARGSGEIPPHASG